MDRETFEQLVSEWLDQPERDDLRAAVAAAASKSPELQRLKDEWIRLDRLVRGLPSAADQVDWPRFRERSSQRLDQADTELDEKLRTLTAIEERVDWPRLRERITQAAYGTIERPPLIPVRWRRAALGITSVAAAVLALLILVPLRSAKVGVARVHVSAPVESSAADSQPQGYARVSVSPPPDPEEADSETVPAGPGAARPQLAEVFLMVEPVQVAARTRASLIPFGFNQGVHHE